MTNGNKIWPSISTPSFGDLRMRDNQIWAWSKIIINFIQLLCKDINNISVETAAARDEEGENHMENEMADKLDILMEILFNYIHDTTHINGEFCCKFDVNFNSMRWLSFFCVDSQFFFFLGEHNLDAGTELFNELLEVSGLIRTHDVEA